MERKIRYESKKVDIKEIKRDKKVKKLYKIKKKEITVFFFY